VAALVGRAGRLTGCPRLAQDKSPFFNATGAFVASAFAASFALFSLSWLESTASFGSH